MINSYRSVLPSPRSRWKAAATAIAIAVIATTGIAPAQAEEDPAPFDKPCTDIEAVFVRGSGQPLEDGEFNKFNDELESRIFAPVTYNVYELGTSEIGGKQYPAVSVSNVWNGNAIGAFFGGGYAYDYGDSVAEGDAELISYVMRRGYDCPEALFILAGYSQGAQVVGQTYSWALADVMGDRIVFNALFGDPKLNLPEGRGFRPPACRGEELSPWRRAIANCKVDNGSLGVRDPYLAAPWDSASGLWCNADDYVCGSSKMLWQTSGHMTYGTDGGAIEEAVIEALARLKPRLPNSLGLSLDTSIITIGTGTTGLDIVFVIDSTGSMGGQIANAKQFARDSAAQIESLRGRVALVEYRDAGDEFVARTLSSFTDGYDAFIEAVDRITVGGGGDEPEATLSALMHAFDGQDWKPGATKAAVVLSDAGFHEPDRATGWTVDDVARRALEIDPVNVYTVTSKRIAPMYAELAELTSGKVIINTGDAQSALQEALTQIADRPVVRLPIDAYYAEPGQSIRFDASASYSTTSEIEEFAWDFEGDGVFESVGKQDVVDHVYASEFTGQMQVRVTTLDGAVANHSVPVTISSVDRSTDGAPAAPGDVEITVLSTEDGISTISLSWEPVDELADRWLVALEGIDIGLAAAETTTVTVADVRRSNDAVLSVAGVTAEGLRGERTEVVLNAESSSEPVPPTTSPTTPSEPSAETAGDSGPTGSGSPVATESTADNNADLSTDDAGTPVASATASAGVAGPFPVTGINATGVIAAAVVLLLVGSALLLVRRRRSS